MIGDWVHIAAPVIGRAEYDTQVYGVGPDVILVHKDSGANSIDLDRVQPIPLTVEILEKNCESSQFGNEMPHYWEWHGTIYYGPEGWTEMPMYYVHEWQNLMRLCGMDETADNFKI